MTREEFEKEYEPPEKWKAFKKRVLDALEGESAYCSPSYIAKKLNLSKDEGLVSDALEELEDDDIIVLGYLPCYCYPWKEESDSKPVKDSECFNTGERFR